jgi:hypothetical protein
MPISKPRDMNFANPTLELSDEQFKAVQQKIIDAL